MKRFLLTAMAQLTMLAAFAQNVGIGTTMPTNQLQIGVTPGFLDNHFAIGNGIQAMSFNQAAASSIWYSNTAFSLMPNGSKYINTGYLGLGTVTPLYPLTLQTPPNISSWGLFHTDGTVQVGEYIGANAFAEFGTRSNHPLYIFTNNADAIPAINIGADSKVGILTSLAPANYLQVGTTPGFSGNQLALGNGTQAMSFSTGTTASTWYSNVNFAMMPAGGNGNLGIGTTAPSQRLEVNGNVKITGRIIMETPQTITLLNSFTTYSLYGAPQFYKDKENQVHLRGVCDQYCSQQCV